MEVCEIANEPCEVSGSDELDKTSDPLPWQVIFLPIIVTIIVSVIVANTSLFASHPAEIIIPVPTQAPESYPSIVYTNATSANWSSYYGENIYNTTYFYTINQSYVNQSYWNATNIYILV